MAYYGKNDGTALAQAAAGEHITIGGVTSLDSTAKRIPLLTNATGALVTTTTGSSGSITRANSSALEASRVIKASAGTLWDVIVYNDKGSTQYIQLFDSATVPADATAPIMTFPIATKSTVGISFQEGMPFATGIAISNSSTAATKTIGSADCYFTANYV